MEATAYRGKPGAYLLVEKYHGSADQSFEVPTPAEGARMATGLYESHAFVDAVQFVSFELYDDQGRLTPFPEKNGVLN